MTQPYVFDPGFKRYVPVEFTTDGRISRYFILKDDIAKEAASYISIINDLTECDKNLTLFKKLLEEGSADTLVKSALFTSTVTLYIRCFNQSWGRTASIRPGIFDGIIELKQYHTEMDTMRNQFIGHAGVSKHETVSLVVYFDPTSEAILATRASINRHQFGHDIDTFIRLIDVAMQEAKQRFNESRPKLEEYLALQDHYRMFRRAKIPKEKDFI